ncbi:Signal transduction histidine kinase [Candidatus Burkholderia verschuerenii]|uniref:histidine kinase n=1 Tax=Candidatus Burkholderia verschuerenii TaxID=242163 RepID=A0A0L0MDK4_9BURK|nr:ATP-binding protein [Candidatus Burkholderia verschuerenii]KND60350.1 Signal transduction histidine kinase [Candidatus Burkholderia verschuerenii]
MKAVSFWLRRRAAGLFNTLFGRMALISIVALLIVQMGWFAILQSQGKRNEADGFARGLLLVLEAAHSDVAIDGRLARAMHVHIVPVWNMPKPVTLRAPEKTHHAHLARQIADGLPQGTEIAVDEDAHGNSRLWVRYPSSSFWIVTPIDLPPPAPFVPKSIVMLLGAVLLSLIATWQLQKPFARVAQAARRFGDGERPVPVAEQGPGELRELIGAFNQMMRRVSDAEDDKTVMLAGIAHDLKAPITRLRLRASVLEDEASRARGDTLRDIDSLTRIVQQFLEFAARTPGDGAPSGVDAFIAEQFPAPEDGGDALFTLSLTAGDAFRLPRTFIDRLMTNLVDNALEHGEPPVEIRTARIDGEWLIEVRDYGPGIPDERIADALRPFVRLDPARSGDGHCGLGLAIVTRLAQEQNGRCEIGNAEGGGLIVRIAIPVGDARTCRIESDAALMTA